MAKNITVSECERLRVCHLYTLFNVKCTLQTLYRVVFHVCVRVCV